MAPKTTKAGPVVKAIPPAPTTGPTSSSNESSTTAKASTSLIPLQHYGARVPLQLAAVFFALSTSSSRHVPHTTPQAKILQSLIHDPAAFLCSACGMVAVVQIWFGVWCKGILEQSQQQPSKDDIRQSKTEVEERKSFSKMFGEALGGVRPTARPRTSLKSRTSGGLGSLGLETLMPAMITTLVLALVIHVIAFTLGAPLIRSIPETFLLSLLVSILAFLPLAITFGQPHPKKPERFLWLRLFSLAPQTHLEVALLLPALGALAGAWLGAVPIPLDWDRAWQKWPTTCVVGALLGHGVGSIVALVAVTMGYPTGAKAGSTKPKSA
ncbi:BQ2448_6682 [Microbotryum intermedium]|uniref:BQ2448_6682 protein n=1 Tax=Microbotryum intermedium TaxID=269621 RepID=A0A238FKC7_9BASI|nr:BQ2448_6682 [Microbotryum intermedium]